MSVGITMLKNAYRAQRLDRCDYITLPREVVEKALRRAFYLGQDYWRDADSDSRAAHKRADKHLQDFDALCSDVLALAAEQPKQEPVAKAWAEGYQQGVKDERTSEASIGIAGFGAKVEPARQNPYGTALAAEQPKPEPVAWQERHLFPGMGKWTNWYEHERPRLAHHPLEEVHDCVRYQFRPLYTFPLDTEALRRENERLRELLAETANATWFNCNSDLLSRIHAALLREDKT